MSRSRGFGTGLPLAFLLAVAFCSCLLHPLQSDAAVAGIKPCGSYFESGRFGEYRVSVTNRHVACGPAITIVREFRSFLPKRHHGPAGHAGSWTLPADPGWNCRRQGSEGSCDRGPAVARFRASVLSSRDRCSSLVSHSTGAIFLSWRHVGCGLRHRIGRSLLNGSRRQKVGGFRCRNLDLRAGGGGALCRRGGRFLEIGFE
jgi:hypothetical protein